MGRELTERDLRAPEFRDGDPSDYECRDDGKIVRKDRWERGMRSIGFLLSGVGGFEIDQVVEDVRLLCRSTRRTRTDQEIVDQTEELARKFADADGYTLIGESFRGAEAPRAQKAWQLACMAQEFLTNTDVENAVANLD